MPLFQFLVSRAMQFFASKAALRLVVIGLEAKAQSYRAKTMISSDTEDDAYGVAAVEAVESLKHFLSQP